jgi:protoporphyrinogen oxidase
LADTRVVILGAGPAGVGGAYALTRDRRAQVTVIEAQPVVGGNAGSFTWEGLRLDYGSHRLHPACDPDILADIRRLLGGDLLDRPRHGRIRLRGRWIHFPLKPVDLALRLDPGFALGSLRDAATRMLGGKRDEGITFASVLQANLGETICRDFYFPYARKIWGREPEALSGIQARRRVSAGSIGKLVRKVLSAVPGLKPPGAGRFFYPKQGYGQISEAYADAATRAGATMMLGWRVTGVTRRPGEPARWAVTAERGGEQRTWTADHVWSTLPISLLARMTTPAPPAAVTAAAGAIDYRAMILVYLALDVPRFTEFDAHYLPGADIAITRLSEPKNYADLQEPAGRTVLCAELPCSPGDGRWEMDDASLGKLVEEDLARAGIPLARPPVGVMVRRLRQAYPIYLNGYEGPFGVLDAWAESMPGLLTYGRQGLFAHDNTHHALFMAYAAAACLNEGRFDDERWRRYRDVFATHVVED